MRLQTEGLYRPLCERTLCSAHYDISRSESLAQGRVGVQLLNSSGLDDEIFLIEESGVKSALFSRLTPLSEDELSPDFAFAHWNELLASNKSLYS